jgi:type I restriction enzyme R subunit
MNTIPEIKETYSAHVPALRVLSALGWEYLSPAGCLAARGSTQEVVLTNVLVEQLRRRRFEYKGKFYPLSTNAIDQVVRELAAPPLHEGLLQQTDSRSHRH